MEFRLAREGSEELQELVRRLHELGFRRTKRDEQVKTLRKALQVYKSVYGDVNVTKVTIILDISVVLLLCFSIV